MPHGHADYARLKSFVHQALSGLINFIGVGFVPTVKVGEQPNVLNARFFHERKALSDFGMMHNVPSAHVVIEGKGHGFTPPYSSMRCISSNTASSSPKETYEPEPPMSSRLTMMITVTSFTGSI